MQRTTHGIVANLAAATMALAVGSSRHVAVHDDGPRQPRYSGNWRLNRSRKWPRAESYVDARAMSPYPHRPIR